MSIVYFVSSIVAALLLPLATTFVLWLASRRWAVAWRGGLLVPLVLLAVLVLFKQGMPRLKTDWRGGTVLTFQRKSTGPDRQVPDGEAMDQQIMIRAVEQRLRDVAGGGAEARLVSDQRLEVRVPGDANDSVPMKSKCWFSPTTAFT